jgi:hypothetical protein
VPVTKHTDERCNRKALVSLVTIRITKWAYMIACPYGALKLSKFAYTHEADTGTYCTLKEQRHGCSTYETKSRHYLSILKDVDQAVPAHVLQRFGVDVWGLCDRVGRQAWKCQGGLRLYHCMCCPAEEVE